MASLAGLDSLQRAGALVIFWQPRLTSLSGLESLVQVEDSLAIVDNQALTSLNGLSGLRQAPLVSVASLPLLTDFNGLQSVSVEALSLHDLPIASLAGLEGLTVSGSLDILSAPRLTSLTGLPQLAGASLTIVEAPILLSLTELAGLDALSRLTLQDTAVQDLDALSNLRELGRLELLSNPQLTQLDAVAGVAGLEALIVWRNPELRALPSFARAAARACEDCPELELQVAENAVLETGPAFPGVQRALNVLIADNPRLTGVSGLGALRSVQELVVVDNASLSALDLSNLEQAEKVLIRGNGVLDDTPLSPLRMRLDARVKIVSNLDGPALLSPCPWTSDFTCDELLNDCAAGTDVADCAAIGL